MPSPAISAVAGPGLDAAGGPRPPGSRFRQWLRLLRLACMGRGARPASEPLRLPRPRDSQAHRRVARTRPARRPANLTALIFAPCTRVAGRNHPAGHIDLSIHDCTQPTPSSTCTNRVPRGAWLDLGVASAGTRHQSRSRVAGTRARLGLAAESRRRPPARPVAQPRGGGGGGDGGGGAHGDAELAPGGGGGDARRRSVGASGRSPRLRARRRRVSLITSHTATPATATGPVTRPRRYARVSSSVSALGAPGAARRPRRHVRWEVSAPPGLGPSA